MLTSTYVCVVRLMKEPRRSFIAIEYKRLGSGSHKALNTINQDSTLLYVFTLT